MKNGYAGSTSGGAGYAPARSSSRVELKQNETAYFSQLFELVRNKSSNRAEGKDAIAFLRKSRLPNDALKRIWNLVAKSDSMSLDRDEFFSALKLIAFAQTGKEVNESVLASGGAADVSFPQLDSVPPPPAPVVAPAAQQRGSSDDPFAEIMTNSYGGGVKPLSSLPQIEAPPPPPPPYRPAAAPAAPRSLMDRLPPPPPMHSVLPKSGQVERGPKIDPSMRGVLEEQDSDLYVPAGKTAVEGDNKDQLKSYTEQLASLHLERTKLKKSIAAQKADLAKEEDFLRHYQAQIAKTLDEYMQARKELEETLTKRIVALESRPAGLPARTYESPMPTRPVQASPAVCPPRQAAPTMAPPQQPYYPPSSTSSAGNSNKSPAPEFVAASPAPQPRPAAYSSPAPPVATQAPAQTYNRQPPPAVSAPPARAEESKRPPPAQQQQQSVVGFEQPKTNAGAVSAFDWGNGRDEFGNVGVRKAQGTTVGAEPEFDFS